MDQRWIVAGLLVVGGSAGAAAPRRIAPAIAIDEREIAVSCQPRQLATRFGAPGAIHIARPGELLVPPGAYATGAGPIDAQGQAGGGPRYDIAFLARDRDGITLELRTYGEGEATRPATSRFVRMPSAERKVRLRDLSIMIVASSAATLSYRVERDAAAPTDEAATNECPRDRIDVDLAIPPR